MLNKFPRLNKYIRRYWILICTFSLICTLIVSNQPSYSLTVQDVPNPRQQNGGWVTDMVDMLSPQAETQLNQMISELENQDGTEIAVVTVPETKPSSTPKEFTTELFNTWGIGKKGQDNGILFLISKGDRRTEIETGKGIEGILTNAKVRNILRKQITPEFKKGNFEAGIIAGTKALIQELGTDGLVEDSLVEDSSNIDFLESDDELTVESEDTNNDYSNSILWFFRLAPLLIILVPLFVLFILVNSVRNIIDFLSDESPRRSSRRGYWGSSSSDGGGGGFDGGGGGFDGGGGGDCGGGGDFGGGGSDGGGDGGSW